MKKNGGNKLEESAVFTMADFLKRAEAAYPDNWAQFQQAVKEDRRSHLYLLSGLGQEEKLALSLAFASQVLGDDETTEERIGQFDHPDLVTVLPEKKGASIKIAQIRAIVPELTTTALEAPVKVFIIDRAETLTTAAANSLLKFIEEPAGPQLILLLAEKSEEVLPTIVSRAQVVHLKPSAEVAEKAKEGLASFEREVQPAVFKWFEKVVSRDVSSMAYLQTTLIKNVSEKEQEETVLLWLQQLARDVFMQKTVSNPTLYFPQLTGFYQQAAKHYSSQQLQALVEEFLSVDKLKKVQLAFQSKLEKLALESAILLG
ncbi:DNA polymerase III subunit delta [Fructobacillus sp. M1-13]|uniref:DNA polymerase III subunit delta n=1 Tax=Fructobacillus papyriferae TaxID=2713171 RepID=A0ABS5QQ32_9LACO|nr:DNA polymerase III subunit delta [Fructobacillus papyriferae]MBS9335205.1 DNA polymerase III subunit delta [Fructobacillus papyriferae]MCD2159126.1 DNA polymerase III subunit delta [Fructobacillus papyriferae]